MKISEYSIRKPITTVMVALSVVVMGYIGLMRLPLQSTPDISWPTINISSRYPSSSPEEVEREISQPLEEVMGTLPSLKSISSRSYGTSSRISLEFDHGTDMDLMFVHVRDRIDQVRNDLPDDLERIEIYRWSSQDWPIFTYTLTWKGDDPEELADVYEDIILPRIQRLEGVGSVEVEGLEEKALLVEVDQDLLNSYRMDIRSLNWAIRNSNINHSAGHVSEAGRRLSVRTVGEFEKVDQIRELPVRGSLNLSDIADVSYDYPEKNRYERMDGRDAVTVEIRKSSTANLVATAKGIRAEMAKIQEEVGADRLIVTIIRDRSIDVTDGISNLAQSAGLGGILAVIVIFVFLRNFRSTLIIGSAIPISVLCVFIMMYLIREFSGSTITLNLVSMMGLMVAIGMLVDPAVVALENIFRKRFEEGMEPLQAALEGSKEIGMPVLAAALTTVCVFIPLIFVDDVSGNSLWMRDFAVTVVISVIASLVVALSLVPLAGSRAFGQGGRSVDRWLKAGLVIGVAAVFAYYVNANGFLALVTGLQEDIVWLVSGLSTVPVAGWLAVGGVLSILAILTYKFREIGLKQLYVKIVNVTLRYRWTTIAAASVVLYVGFFIYGLVEQQPFRWQPSRRVDFQVDVPRSNSLEDNFALFRMVEDLLIPRKKELDIKAVNTRFSDGTSHRITLHLTSPEESTLSTDEVKEKVKALFPTDIPGVQLKSGRAYGGGGSSVSVELKGRNAEVLAMLAEDVRLRMDGIRGVQEVETSLETGTEEIQVTINRDRAQRYGLTPRDIATTLASALGSRGNSKFKTDEREIDITVLLREEDRANLEELKNTSFESSQGTLVSFASLADFNLKKAPNTLRRDNRMATVQVIANTEQWARFSAGQQMETRMKAIALPSGYTWEMGRSHRWARQEQGQNTFTMLFAAFLIYLIMAALFESYIHPFTIMFTIGFAFIGVAVGLYCFNVPMDSSASYGLLILFGIVVNNGIVLVDHINRYRHQGLFRRDAIIRGGQDRLRPILMTAATTILGLTPLVIPMIYGTAEGNAKRWGPIGLVVISGLSFSTVLTLVLLPTVYSLMDDMGRFIKRVFASARTA